MAIRPSRPCTITCSPTPSRILLATAAALLLSAQARAQAIISDAFDTGLNGWAMYNDGENLRWDPTSGNPNGCIRADDAGGGTYWGFVAPPAYTGDRSCLYGGVLAWQLRTTHASAGSGASQPDVTLLGAGLMLVRDLPLPVPNTWFSQIVTLNETAGWRKSSYSGAVPTQSEFQSVLANLTGIRIRAEFSGSVDAAQLDNVALASFLVSSPDSASVCPGTLMEFSAPVIAGAANGPFTFQWRKDAAIIDVIDYPSAATPTLTLGPVQESDAGSYDCVVTNACGSVISNPATLSVCPGDYNCDGGIDGGDVETFFADWEAGNEVADVNADGGIDGADVEFFFARWELGC